MARNQKNFRFFTYTDDDGTAWNKRGEDGGAAAAVDGHTAAVASQPVWEETRRNSVRRIVYQDATTGRTIDPIFYTPAAYAAVALGATLAVPVTGDTAAVTYTAVRKLPEKKRGAPAFTRQLADA